MSNLKEDLASLMHDSGKCYLMIDRDERQENNYRLANKALALFESYVKACKPELPATFAQLDDFGVMMYKKATFEYEQALLKELKG